MSKRENESAAVLQAVYKCGRMGSDSAVSILKHVKSDEMRSDMTAIIDGYRKLSSDSSEKLMKLGVTPEDSDIAAKIGSKIGMTFNTMLDSSNSHLAEMVIQGANMGVTDLQGKINEYDGTSCSDEAIDAAKRGVRFNEQVIEDMKKYL